MFVIKTIKGQELEFKNVADVFNTTRKERNEYFGKYVAEKPIKIGAVADKIKELEKEYKLYLDNLEALANAVDVEKKADDAKKLTAQVDGMNEEQLALLKEAIEAKEKQQQN